MRRYAHARLHAHRFGGVALAALVAVAAGLFVAVPAAGSSATMLAKARAIGAEVDARYRLRSAGGLSVAEVSSTRVVRSLTLLTETAEEPRVVSAARGVYFAICPVAATCPYPARAAARAASGALSLRLGLELTLRTFEETAANLVVVALPTREPVWLVFERDVLAGLDAVSALRALTRPPAGPDASIDELLRVAAARLFLPIPLLPPPPDTIYALQLSP